MQYRSTPIIGSFLGVLLLGTGPTQAGPHLHAGDIVVGQTGDGRLAAEVPASIDELMPIHGILAGWAGDEPGFMSLDKDEPLEDFFTLPAGAMIRVELITIDPAFKIWSPGFSDVLDSPLDSFIVGGAQFDVHPTFHVDLTDPAFNPNTNLYSATLRFVDDGTTALLPSEPLILTFAIVPEPSIVGWLAIGTASLLTSRQRRIGRPS